MHLKVEQVLIILRVFVPRCLKLSAINGRRDVRNARKDLLALGIK